MQVDFSQTAVSSSQVARHLMRLRACVRVCARCVHSCACVRARMRCVRVRQCVRACALRACMLACVCARACARALSVSVSSSRKNLADKTSMRLQKNDPPPFGPAESRRST